MYFCNVQQKGMDSLHFPLWESESNNAPSIRTTARNEVGALPDIGRWGPPVAADSLSGFDSLSQTSSAF